MNRNRIVSSLLAGTLALSSLSAAVFAQDFSEPIADDVIPELAGGQIPGLNVVSHEEGFGIARRTDSTQYTVYGTGTIELTENFPGVMYIVTEDLAPNPHSEITLDLNGFKLANDKMPNVIFIEKGAIVHVLDHGQPANIRLIEKSEGPNMVVSTLDEAKKQDTYRLYNKNSGEHFYTNDKNESDNLVRAGWTFENPEWQSPEEPYGDPIFRLYNANTGDHHYTKDQDERNYLLYVGWKDEGLAFLSDTQQRTPVYRVYNPNAAVGSHHYTTNLEEARALEAAGWTFEGVCWYGM
ncbi:MAG: hypothetical protein ACI32F_06835 [Allobaculum sp.]